MGSKKKEKTSHWIEVVGIVLIGFSVFVMCCLISYNPADPSFETGISGTPPYIHNWGKQVGAYLSSLLFQIMGLGSYAVPVSLFLLSIKLLFFPRFPYRFYIRLCLYILLFLCCETFLSLFFGVLDLEKYTFDAGGALMGGIISSGLTAAIGPFGTYLLIVIIALLIVMGLTKISYVSLWNSTTSTLKGSAQEFLGTVLSRLKNISLKGLMRKKKKRAPDPERAPVKEKEVPEPAGNEGLLPEHTAANASRKPLTDEIPITVYREKNPDEKGSDGTFTVRTGPAKASKMYKLPPVSLLDEPDQGNIEVHRELLMDDADVLMKKLSDFGVKGKVVGISPGPVITRFEYEPASGIKLNKIVGLSDDLALALKAMSVRIAPIPGKSVVGIELPSKKRKKVSFREVVARDEFQGSGSKLTIGLGKDIAGGTIINDLSRMPHLLIAGTTGSGKSVFINTVICSILFKATPDEVRFLMIDPKRLELYPYDGIPHLLHPVVVDPKKAAVALRWAVEEMDRRYKLLADMNTRDIVQYNKKIAKLEKDGDELPEDHRKMTYIVVVIDELADLMMIAARDVEGYIARLAQMARASGMHLLVATQRPSVDILTGVIKANFPSRISFKVSSKVDSRTILDTVGAEKLLGMGDMLSIPPGTSRLQRIHGAYIAEKEITRITEFVKKQGKPLYDESIVELKEDEAAGAVEEEDYDELYDKAVELVAETRQASISMLQRRMRVGYNRAARMIERMEREGVVGPSDGVKPRDVLINRLPKP